MSNTHTPGPWSCPNVNDECSSRQFWVLDEEGGLVARIADEMLGGSEIAAANTQLIAEVPKLLSIAERLALATNEGDDAPQGTHYIDKQGRIRCKGSFLALIEDARAAIANATGGAS